MIALAPVWTDLFSVVNEIAREIMDADYLRAYPVHALACQRAPCRRGQLRGFIASPVDSYRVAAHGGPGFLDAPHICLAAVEVRREFPGLLGGGGAATCIHPRVGRLRAG